MSFAASRRLPRTLPLLRSNNGRPPRPTTTRATGCDGCVARSDGAAFRATTTARPLLRQRQDPARRDFFSSSSSQSVRQDWARYPRVALLQEVHEQPYAASLNTLTSQSRGFSSSSSTSPMTAMMTPNAPVWNANPIQAHNGYHQEQWNMMEGSESTIPTDHSNHHHGSPGSDEDDDDGMFWATLVMAALIGSNLLALWCEKNMTPDQSLLRGLATLRTVSDPNDDKDERRRGSDGDGDDDASPSGVGGPDPKKFSRRRTTRIVYLHW